MNPRLVKITAVSTLLIGALFLLFAEQVLFQLDDGIDTNQGAQPKTIKSKDEKQISGFSQQADMQTPSVQKPPETQLSEVDGIGSILNTATYSSDDPELIDALEAIDCEQLKVLENWPHQVGLHQQFFDLSASYQENSDSMSDFDNYALDIHSYNDEALRVLVDEGDQRATSLFAGRKHKAGAFEEAVMYFQKAAELGDTSAYIALVTAYADLALKYKREGEALKYEQSLLNFATWLKLVDIRFGAQYALTMRDVMSKLMKDYGVDQEILDEAEFLAVDKYIDLESKSIEAGNGKLLNAPNLEALSLTDSQGKRVFQKDHIADLNLRCEFEGNYEFFIEE